MIAEINSDGKMTVKAENELESYALAKWNEDWYDNKAVFAIKTHGDTRAELIINTQGP